MHFNKICGLTAWMTIIPIIILMHSTIASTNDNATDDTIIHKNSRPTPILGLFPYNINFTMAIAPLTVELKKLGDYIQRVNEHLQLMNPLKKISNHKKVKRGVGNEKPEDNINKITISNREITTEINHFLNRKKIKRNIKSSVDDKLVDQREVNPETPMMEAADEDSSTTECVLHDATDEESIDTSGTSMTLFESSTTPLPPSTTIPTDGETICDDEVIDDDDITTSTQLSPLSTAFTDTEGTQDIATTLSPTTTKAPESIAPTFDRSTDVTISTVPITSVPLTTTSSSSPPSPTTDVIPTTCYYEDDSDSNSDDTDMEPLQASESVENPMIENLHADDDKVERIIRRNLEEFPKNSITQPSSVNQPPTFDSTDPLNLMKKKKTSRIDLMRNWKNGKLKKSSLLHLNQRNLNKFSESSKEFKRHMHVGRTLKSISDDEDFRVQEVTVIEKPYRFRNRKILSFGQTYNRKSINNGERALAHNMRTLRSEKSNLKNQFDFRKMPRDCTNCICDIENAIASLKNLLTLQSNSLDRILEYSCDKFLDIGKYLELISPQEMPDQNFSFGFSQTFTEFDTKGLKYLEFDDAKDILRVGRLNSNEHELLYIPGTSYLLNIPCHHKNGDIISWLQMSPSPPNYTWTRPDGGSIAGMVKKNGDLILHEVDIADAGNYSCIVTYINPDNEKIVQTIYEHTIKLVTLPHYIIRGNNRYRLDICDEYKLDILTTRLPIKLNEIVCKFKLCNAFVFAPQCHNHDVFIRTLIIPSNILKIIPSIITSECGLKCHKAIYDKIVWLIIRNLRTILQKPFIFRLSNHRHEKLFPIGDEERVQSMPEETQEQKTDARDDDISEDVGLLVGCPVGYSLGFSYCEPCPSNFHSQDLSWRCQQCPLGTYQPNMGAKTCETCTNPFVKGCFIMLLSSLSFVLIIFVILSIFLIVIIILWMTCCGNPRTNCYTCSTSSNVDNDSDRVPLINANEGVDNCHDDCSIPNNSHTRNNTDREHIHQNDERPLLIYGVNLLPLRRTNQRSCENICRHCRKLYYSTPCRRTNKKHHPPVPPQPDFDR